MAIGAVRIGKYPCQCFIVESARTVTFVTSLGWVVVDLFHFIPLYKRSRIIVMAVFAVFVGVVCFIV